MNIKDKIDELTRRPQKANMPVSDDKTNPDKIALEAFFTAVNYNEKVVDAVLDSKGHELRRKIFDTDLPTLLIAAHQTVLLQDILRQLTVKEGSHVSK